MNAPPTRLRVVSFNANGIRSATQKGFFRWFARQDADVLCVQETKAQAEQLVDRKYRPAGYHAYFRDATTKRGYSGVAIYTRHPPDEVRTAIGWRPFDEEGRYLEARFGELSVVSLYFPSGSSGELRQRFKFRCMRWFGDVLDEWRQSGRKYVLCGDWNIVHTRKDIRNWTSNQKNSGCLPKERAWLESHFVERGWVDSYRHLHPEGEDYTWWSQRGQARKKNVGWRIDYQVVTPNLRGHLRGWAIAPRTRRFSDHAPYVVDYAFER